MTQKIDREFGSLLLTSMEDFNAYGIHLLFNDWWAKAPQDAIAKYVAAIEQHPEQGPLAALEWYAPPLSLAELEPFGQASLGGAYLAFMRDNGLVERLALGYRELHEEFEASGKLNNMPPILKHKVLRGYQTHDLHHVLTGYPATPLGELALQAFQLAQTQFPYASMWISVVTGHMTFLDPYLTVPAMDAITDGWRFGRQAKSIQFVQFETMLERPLDAVRQEFGLIRDDRPAFLTPSTQTPELLKAAA